MAYKKKSESKNKGTGTGTGRKYGTVHFDNIAVNNATEFSNGNIGFTLFADGMVFYNMILVNPNGDAFLSTPSRKGSNDKYYSYYYLNLDEDTTNRIIKAVVE